MSITTDTAEVDALLRRHALTVLASNALMMSTDDLDRWVTQAGIDPNPTRPHPTSRRQAIQSMAQRALQRTPSIHDTSADLSFERWERGLSLLIGQRLGVALCDLPDTDTAAGYESGASIVQFYGDVIAPLAATLR